MTDLALKSNARTRGRFLWDHKRTQGKQVALLN